LRHIQFCALTPELGRLRCLQRRVLRSTEMNLERSAFASGLRPMADLSPPNPFCVAKPPRSATRGMAELLLAVLAGAVGIGLSAYWIRSASSGAKVPDLAKSLTVSGLDFGEAWEQSDFVHAITIHNASDGQVNIARFVTSCGCTAIEPGVVAVPARGEVVVPIRLNLIGKVGPADLGHRVFGAIITPLLIESPLQFDWQIKGVVKRALLADRDAVSFGTPMIAGEPFPTATVHVSLLHSAGLAEATVEPATLGSLAASPSNADGCAFSVEFTPNKDLPLGLFKGEIRLVGKDHDGNPLPPLIIPVSGNIRQSVFAEPANLYFGARQLGSILNGSLSIHAARDESFEVLEVNPSNPCLAVRLVPNAPAKQPTYQVSCRIERVGHFTSEIRFLVRQGQKPPFSVCVPVRSFGLEP
jgi:hypothetical protein